MQRDDRRLAFLKSLIAAAWADGQLEQAEIRTLAHYLHMFEISDEEYEQLKPLLETAMDPKDALDLVEEQLQILASKEEQQTLVAAVEDLLISDGLITESEQLFLSKLRILTREAPTAKVFIARLKEIWSATSEERPAGARGAVPDATLQRFMRTRILEFFRRRIVLSRARSGLPLDSSVSDCELYLAIIRAGLLSRVASADADFCPAEREQLVAVLEVGTELPRPDLEVVVGAFFGNEVADLDLGTLVKEFNQISDGGDGSELLDCLFVVAAADGVLQITEVDVIRQIAVGAGFSTTAFNTSLSRCRHRLSAGWN